jgi:hypothetical protein
MKHKNSSSVGINKTTYGEVFTPPDFARNMLLETLSQHIFKNPALKWLDIGAGRGCFGVALRCILNDTLADAIPDAAARDRHIITQMLHMVEINPDNVAGYLRPLFGLDANIHQADYLTWDPPPAVHYDVIIGNPPFNCDGAIKVPTNSTTDKRDDGRTVWPHFVRKTLVLMRRCGEQGNSSATMCILIPSIWMKPADKSGIFDELVTSKFGVVSRLRCFTSLESNRIFRSGGGAQTPCCYFAYKANTNKNSKNTCIELRDDNAETGNTLYSVTPPRPIPLCGASIINKLLALMSRTTGQHVRVFKTNMPGKGVTLSPGATATEEHTHPCIHSCTICTDNDGMKNLPQLSIRYSSHPCAYAGVPKIVLAHKMYGYPYLDLAGEYGISNRDSYVIELVCGADGLPDTAWAVQMMAYLSSPIALMVYDATRYRMQYLERYAFELLPMPPFPFSNAAHILGLTASEIAFLSQRRYRPLPMFPLPASTSTSTS